MSLVVAVPSRLKYQTGPVNGARSFCELTKGEFISEEKW
jgi:hypothetical protein